METVKSSLYRCNKCGAVQRSLYKPTACNHCVCHVSPELDGARGMAMTFISPNGKTTTRSVTVNCPNRCKSKDIEVYIPGQLPKASGVFNRVCRYNQPDKTPEMIGVKWHEGVAYKPIDDQDPDDEQTKFIALKVRIAKTNSGFRVKVRFTDKSTGKSQWVEKSPKNCGFNPEKAWDRMLETGKYITVSDVSKE